MNDSSCPRRRIAGYNQFAKLLRKGNVIKVYIAKDADPYFSDNIFRELVNHKEIEVSTKYSAERLAQMMGVDVPTAVVTEILDREEK